jgi:hypothetical protein
MEDTILDINELLIITAVTEEEGTISFHLAGF